MTMVFTRSHLLPFNESLSANDKCVEASWLGLFVLEDKEKQMLISANCSVHGMSNCFPVQRVHRF
ncbi:hypothetical protein T4E_8938 [Trichinella pseudospiralis]|uniref:Uncharacterized protein n=1 Tax=Trichinella pseudospiralis TaxID=6337 RepID=A0A0V0XI18_TRIPS|nr:hypothetical protein T4E_8938 [Trichinella pseudospiralis]